jgi:ActR/RegA family two-component response regulator
MRYFASLGFGPSGARSGSLVVCEPSGYVPQSRRVLLVDDDVVSLETWALLLADAGVQVEVAPSADACLRLAHEREFDLIVIDYRLGDDNGLEVMRRLRGRGSAVPFILATGHASVALTVEAMRLGARTVLEKPLVGDEFVAPVLRELQAIEVDRGLAPAAGRAAAERWARYVLRAADADSDPRTLADWARAAGVSRTVLIDVCVRLEINPRHARDLARVLRLVRRASEPWDPESALDVADRRTLRKLLVRAGLADFPQGVRPSPQQYLASQRFVPQTSAGLVMLRQLLG